MSREFLDLRTGHCQSRVLLELGEVVVVEVVLQQGAAAMEVEPDTLKHRSLLKFGETHILKMYMLLTISLQASY